MAKVKKNSLLDGLSGKVGDLDFCQTDNRLPYAIFVGSAPASALP